MSRLFFTRTQPTLSLSHGDRTEASSAVFMKYSFQDMRLVIFKEVGKTLNMIQTTLPTFFEPNSEEVCQPITEFTRKGKNKDWYCFCNKRAYNCTNSKCKDYGLKHGINVGGGMCIHGRHKSICKECGGSGLCEHNTRRTRCKKCGGGSICIHKIRFDFCAKCNPIGHAIHCRRCRRLDATNGKNPQKTLEDLCMTGEEWVKYLHKTFEDRYGRPKTDEDEVQIDEIIPCSVWNLPDDDKYCWHYLNSQWLLSKDNGAKGNSYAIEDKLAMIERIDDYFRSASAV